MDQSSGVLTPRGQSSVTSLLGLIQMLVDKTVQGSVDLTSAITQLDTAQAELNPQVEQQNKVGDNKRHQYLQNQKELIKERSHQEQYLEQLQQIRLKQIALMNQLYELKQKQRQLILENIGRSRQITKSPASKPALNPVRLRNKPEPLPKYPIEQQISREDFEARVREIADSIRSKVKKTNNKSNQQQSKPKGASIGNKLKEQAVQLPSIPPTKAAFNKLPHKWDQAVSGSYQEQEREMQNMMEPSGKKSEKYIKSIVDEILKKVLSKIEHKQKHALKLDPVHHKYPMTTFRKRILDERGERHGHKDPGQGTKGSLPRPSHQQTKLK